MLVNERSAVRGFRRCKFECTAYPDFGRFSKLCERLSAGADECTLRFAHSHKAHKGPQGPHMGPWGPKGPMPPRGHFWALWGPKGPSGGTGDSGEAPGAPRRLREHFWKNPDFGLPAPPGLRGGSGLAAAFSGLAAAPRGLPASSSRHSRRRTRRILRHGRILRGLAADFERPGGGGGGDNKGWGPPPGLWRPPPGHPGPWAWPGLAGPAGAKAPAGA